MTQKHKNDTDEIQSEFLELMKEFGPTMHRFIRAGSVRSDDSESIEQDFWLKVWRRYEEGKCPEKKEVLPWLYTVARRMSIDHDRKRRSRIEREERLASISEEKLAQESNAERERENVDQARNDAFQDAFVNLDFKYQRVLKLLYFAEAKLTIKQVAERLGISPSMVKKRKARALQLMRSQLEEFPDWILP